MPWHDTYALPVTSTDELHALLADYEHDGSCSCSESALLRWVLLRVMNPQTDEDVGLAREGVRRLQAFDRRARA